MGDPAFDVGFALTHLLSKAHSCVDRRTDFAVAAESFWRTYWQTLGVVPWHEDFEDRVVQHTLACLLARVEGRSPLEYFQDSHRVQQRQAVLALLTRPPQTVSDLIPAFLQRI